MPQVKIPDSRSIDFETTGLNVYDGVKIFSYSIGYPDGEVEVCRVDRDAKTNRKNWQKLGDFFEDTSTRKIAHNCKYEIGMTVVEDIHVPKETIWEDTIIMSHMMQNLAPSHALHNVAHDLCGYPLDIDVKVKALFKVTKSYQTIPEPIMYDYQVADAQRSMLLYQLWYPEIRQDPKLFKDYRIEIAMQQVTQRMEQFGITLDKWNTNKLLGYLEEELKKIEKESYELFGRHVNLLSNKQIGQILYSELKLPVVKKTKSGRPAADKEAIEILSEQYDHPVFDLISRQRAYNKGFAIVSSYKKFAGDSGIIHPNINTNGAVTGRQSSDNPNVQNVAKEAALKNKYTVAARKCFKPRPKSVLFLVDYSGIEMRLIIDATKQPYMMKLLKEGGDPHAEAAKTFLGRIYTDPVTCIKYGLDKNPSNRKEYVQDVEELGREQAREKWYPIFRKLLRGASKNGHFALAYGGGLHRVALTVGMSQEDFKPGFDSYKRRFPQIANFTYNMIKQVKKDGFIITPFGRKLYVPMDTAYMASNYLIQGTAAGILKRAQVALDKYLKEKWNDEIRLVIPIHDELIIDFPRKFLPYRNEILSDMAYHMTYMPEIEVPLEVEWKMTTKTWNDAEPVEF